MDAIKLSVSLSIMATMILIMPTSADADEAAELDPVVVTSAFEARAQSEVVRPVSSISGAELDSRRNRGSLGEILESLPGIHSADFGPGVGRPTIRGLQGARVSTLQDGMRISDVSGEGVDHAVAGDVLGAESIEILRGPATLLYGSGAAGGAVNTITGRFAQEFGIRPEGLLFGAYADNGNDRQLRLAGAAPLGDSGVLRADYGLRRSDDFSIRGFQVDDPDEQDRGRSGTLINSAVDTDSGSITGLWVRDEQWFGLGYSRWETEYGIPEPFDARPRDEGGQSDEFERIFAEFDRVDVKGRLVPRLDLIDALRLNLAYTEFRQDEVEFEFERTSEGGRLEEREVEAAFRQDEWDLRLAVDHAAPWNLTAVSGLDFNHRDFVAEDPSPDRDFFIRPVQSRAIGLFTVQERPTGFGRWEFGLRVSQERISPEAVPDPAVDSISRGDETIHFRGMVDTRTFTPVSGSVGAVIEAGRQHRLRAALTVAERAPSPEQLYAFGRHGAAGTFEVGDPDLDTERYHNLDLGLERHRGRTGFQLNLFYNRVDDFIFFQSEDDGDGNPRRVDGDGNDSPGGEILVFNEQQDAAFHGLEFSLKHELTVGGHSLRVRGMADYVRGRLRNGGDLPRIPPARAGVGMDARIAAVDLSLDYRRVFSQSRTGVAETSTDGFNLVEFRVDYTPMRHPSLNLFLSGQNLLDEPGRRHQSFFRDSAPILGRNLTFGARWDFGG